MGRAHQAEVIGFRGSNVLSMPIDSTEGVRFGDAVWAQGTMARIEAGPALLGRVLNAMGAPIDERRPPVTATTLPLDGALRSPLNRVPISEPLGTGIRVLDAMLTVGRGQRVGIFGGSGVGKSTLIGMMTRNTEAEVTIVGLVGERGREVGEFLRDSLGQEGLARAVVVVSTSDQSPLLRMRAALAATTLAEYLPLRANTCCWCSTHSRASPWQRARSASPPVSHPPPRATRPRSLRAWRGSWSAPAVFRPARSPRSIPC